MSWWPAEGNAVDIIGPNNGAVSGNVQFVASKVGSGFRFTGSGYVQVPDSPSLNLTQGLSLVFWFSRDSQVTGFQSIIAKRDTNLPAPSNYGVNFSDPNYGLGLYYDDPSYTYPENGSDDFNHFEISRIPLPSAEPFHLFAGNFTQLANQVIVDTYIDGALVKSKTMPGTLAASVTPLPLEIGTTIPGFEPYHGILDEVQIYDRPLGAGDIRRIYRAGSSGVCKPVAFAVFSIDEADVELRGPGEQDFEFTASYELDAESRGFDPASNAVTVELGRFTETLPPGSFTCSPAGVCTYAGAGPGITEMTITPNLAIVHGSSAELGDLASPTVRISIRIGHDLAVASVRFLLH